jgi:hypothetical protein
MPVTALGFILANDAIGAVGALIVGSAGIGAGLALVSSSRPGIRQWALRAAGAALLVAMPMGIGWSLAILIGLPFFDLDTMIRTHGALNAAAVLLTAAFLAPDR